LKSVVNQSDLGIVLKKFTFCLVLKLPYSFQLILNWVDRKEQLGTSVMALRAPKPYGFGLTLPKCDEPHPRKKDITKRTCPRGERTRPHCKGS
jgi:hypothetical protein